MNHPPLYRTRMAGLIGREISWFETIGERHPEGRWFLIEIAAVIPFGLSVLLLMIGALIEYAIRWVFSLVSPNRKEDDSPY